MRALWSQVGLVRHVKGNMCPVSAISCQSPTHRSNCHLMSQSQLIVLSCHMGWGKGIEGDSSKVPPIILTAAKGLPSTKVNI